ncbi:MAG: TIGR03936 family radical SAM-associated protein [Acetoanaerobium sp.]|uniref:TIGR03936 family radical SAM-associated protein n=1 Tax=Acetoanaerobium TaxID=186831 RepID=UPI001B6F5E5D|nr:TIGR03936 family radical SAM-associated protein [Acetoanaerobium noterae]MBP8762633.1 TIGR03936 family radical SAM-associated protein [Acetoanaerobium sp.]MBP9499513.1 TIGR03936 family radical SAM-associated protein [Acetoanaerobium sp.]MBP9561844.1 TIGR03936 family radical SAM-associated protein [Acetoanaerobium sp.]
MLVRIKYSKLGDISYISHLDIIKLMERIVRRTGLKLSYSEGFNPHPKTAFSPALQLGVQSHCEYLDMEFDEAVEEDLLIQKLNEKTVEGINFIEAKILTDKVDSLVAFITHSRYEIAVDEEDENKISKIISAINKINNTNEMLLTKKTKKGNIKEYNVKEYIGTIDFERKSDGLSIFVDICSGSVKSINPKKIIELVESLEDLSGIEYDLIKLETYHIDEDTGKKSNIM